jgi:hypothetical protein
MAGQRDYAAEYARRKELAAGRGLSTAQARGHARPAETPISELKREGLISRKRGDFEPRAYRAAQRIEQGDLRSLRKAAQAEGLSPKALSRFVKERDVLRKQTTQNKQDPRNPMVWTGWTAGYRANLSVFSPDLFSGYAVATFDYHTTRILAKYENAIKAALNGDDSRLRQFSGTVVYDVQGNSYRLETNINTIRSILALMTDEEREEYERNFYHAQVTGGLQHAA